jgi:hypothetical protein
MSAVEKLAPSSSGMVMLPGKERSRQQQQQLSQHGTTQAQHGHGSQWQRSGDDACSGVTAAAAAEDVMSAVEKGPQCPAAAT